MTGTLAIAVQAAVLRPGDLPPSLEWVALFVDERPDASGSLPSGWVVEVAWVHTGGTLRGFYDRDLIYGQERP